MSKYEVIFGPYFPVFGLNTEIYEVNFYSRSDFCKTLHRRLWAGLWIYQGSEYINVLNTPGFWIYQGSEYASSHA